MYAAEAAGLGWLAAGPLWVPKVLAVTDRALALEWLAIGAKGSKFDEELGRGLAQLHALGAPMFGHHRPSFLATLPQDNTGARGVVAQWIDRRVGPLCDRARARAAMPDVRDKLELLRERDIWGPREPPARLHGDLWWGNVVAVDGAPCLIDPAVYGGHREVDLAMLALFGGVSDELYAAYQEISPLAAGWRGALAALPTRRARRVVRWGVRRSARPHPRPLRVIAPERRHSSSILDDLVIATAQDGERFVGCLTANSCSREQRVKCSKYRL